MTLNDLNIHWQKMGVSSEQKQKLSGHRSLVIWFTGLSGSGKSTLSQAVELLLYKKGLRTIILDGDNIRHGLCQDLGFSEADRKENIRRVAEVAKLFIDNGTIVLAAFISPSEADRAIARNIIGTHNFLEVYCNCSFEICETRDVKGLYKKARAGEIKNFTGLDISYNPPNAADIVLNTGLITIPEAVDEIMEVIEKKIIQNII